MTRPAEVQEMARALRRDLDEASQRLAATAEQVLAQLGGTAGPIVATFDEDGQLARLSETSPRQHVPSDRLVAEINAALNRAPRPFRPTPPPSAADLATLTEMSRRAAALALETAPGAVRTEWNATRTVSVVVTAPGGVLISIDCSPRWLAATSTPAALDEVVRAVRAATEKHREHEGPTHV